MNGNAQRAACQRDRMCLGVSKKIFNSDRRVEKLEDRFKVAIDTAINERDQDARKLA